MNKNILHSIKIGFLIALVGTVLMLLLLGLNLVGPESVRNDKLMIGGTILFISLYVLLLLGIYNSISNSKKHGDGKLSFRNAFVNGLLISFSTAVFAVVFTVIFYELLFPDYEMDMRNVLTEKLSKENLTETELQSKIEEQTRYYSTAIQAQFAFVGNLITGLAFSLILSLFLKTKNTKS